MASINKISINQELYKKYKSPTRIKGLNRDKIMTFTVKEIDKKRGIIKGILYKGGNSSIKYRLDENSLKNWKY